MNLGDIMRPIHFVLESQTLDKVLTEFLESRQHLFAVLDEYGGLAGVISLEDVLEEMLGHEIVDESDVAPDMREAGPSTPRRRIAGDSRRPVRAPLNGATVPLRFRISGQVPMLQGFPAIENNSCLQSP